MHVDPSEQLAQFAGQSKIMFIIDSNRKGLLKQDVAEFPANV